MKDLSDQDKERLSELDKETKSASELLASLFVGIIIVCLVLVISTWVKFGGFYGSLITLGWIVPLFLFGFKYYIKLEKEKEELKKKRWG